MRCARVALVVVLGCSGADRSAPPSGPASGLKGGRGLERAVDSSDALDLLADRLWQERLERWPRSATYIGERKYDGRLEDISEDAWRKGKERDLLHRGQLNKLLSGDLSGERRVTARVMLEEIERSLENQRACALHTWDVDQLAGPQVTLPQLGRLQKVDSLSAASDYVTRLSGVGALMAQHIDNLKRGVKEGRTAPRVVVERVLKQLDGMQQPSDVAEPYLAAVDGASGLSGDERVRLRADVVAVITHGVVPAWQMYRDFLRDTYLPAARSDVGVSANPGGGGCYTALIRHHTSSTLDANDIHQRGLKELARLHGEMNSLATAEGASDWRDYIKRLEAAPEQHVESRDALVKHNEALVARARAALPQAFGLLPPIPVGVTPIEPFREKDAPAAYYYSASRDGSRPAYYYINTFEPETRPLYNMEALAYHEAVPGHHLQISIAQGLESLPEIRRNGGFTAYVEGWALYSELVADELGLYSSAATKVGMFNYQAWRAARLVVDTGMHAMGWDRQKAIDFMSDNVALPAREIANEIDRYIIWPGQALAYMLGRMEIQALRARAEQSLGDAFDVRAFHDVVLGRGALPLVVLRENVDRWLSETGQNKSAPNKKGKI